MRTCLLIFFLAGALPMTASAELSLNWWTVNGGGGTSLSTDGRFALSGTAGQPDAGFMAGGAFFLEGGFWNGAVSLAPSLWIVHLSNGDLEVCWPLWASDFLLEQTATLTGSPVPWGDVSPGTYDTDDTRCYITVPAPSDTQFYRLYRP